MRICDQWRIEQTGSTDTYNGDYCRVYIVADGGPVATVERCANPRRAMRDDTLSDLPEPPFGPIQMSRARLIVTAPKLLESLRALVCLAERRGSLHEYAAALDVARAAIKEATS